MTGRGRVLRAVAISLALHGLLGLAWFGVRSEEGLPGKDWSTEVDDPDDGEMVINLCEHRVSLVKLPAPAVRAPVPARLPPAVVEPKVAPSNVHEAGHTGPSESPPQSPAPAGGQPLHGKLKAGKSIVYVLDRSSSMGLDGRLRKACAAIKASLAQLSGECRFQIVAYNGGAESFATQLMVAAPTNRSRAERWLDGLLAEGTSKHLVGIREGLWLHPDALFVLTDADDLAESEAKAIRNLLKTPVYVSVFLFGSERRQADSPLIKLAHDIGGDVRYVGR